MKKLTLVTLVASLFAAGCTSIQVEPVSNNLVISDICIEENKKVKVSDFVDVIQSRLRYHGIKSTLVRQDMDSDCEYIMRYHALRSWDFTPYLSHAELALYNQNILIAKGIFHLNGKGGFALTKFNDNYTKMNPVIDKMLNRENDD